MNKTQSKVSRRNFLLTLGTGGVAATAAMIGGAPDAPTASSSRKTPAAGQGYRLTAHISSYYRTTKI